MQRGFRIEPGSAARSAEQEKKAQGQPVAFRIPSAAKAAEEANKAQGPAVKLHIPSAAKAAEELARESGAISEGQYRAAGGIHVRSAQGQKFELPDRPVGAGEALPQAPAAQVQQPPATSSALDPPAPPLARLWGRFRGLFGKM